MCINLLGGDSLSGERNVGNACDQRFLRQPLKYGFIQTSMQFRKTEQCTTDTWEPHSMQIRRRTCVNNK